ncbi:MAG: hypothetical protein JXQ93_01475 [Flavobacteriaceae bacterium]
MKFREYYNTKEFAELANKNEKTIRRLKKRLIENKPKTRLVLEGKPDKYHYSLLRRYLSPRIYQIILDNKSYTNTIRCLKKTDTLEYKLFKMPWKWWCTASYSRELNRGICRDVMTKFYNQIEGKYGEKTKLRMFYTTESFSYRDEAHHNHFVIDVSDSKYHYSIKKELENYFRNDRLYIENYDEYKPCIFYCGKENLNGTAWDILGNDLKTDGICYD